MVPPCSVKVSRAPTYSSLPTIFAISNTGLSPSTVQLSRRFFYNKDRYSNRADPRSLATTNGISVDFFSSGYLDVSVPRVRFMHLYIQCTIPSQMMVGFPIRTSPDQCLFASSPKLFAGSYVLHRLLPPRHPPYALSYLTIQP